MEIFAESKLRFVRIFSPTIWKRCLLPPLPIQSPPKKGNYQLSNFLLLTPILAFMCSSLGQTDAGEGRTKTVYYCEQDLFLRPLWARSTGSVRTDLKCAKGMVVFGQNTRKISFPHKKQIIINSSLAAFLPNTSLNRKTSLPKREVCVHCIFPG